MVSCTGQPDESQCQFNCEMSIGQGNEAFENLLRVSGAYQEDFLMYCTYC